VDRKLNSKSAAAVQHYEKRNESPTPGSPLGGARQRRAEQFGSKDSLKLAPHRKPIFLMTIDDKTFSFSFAFVRSDAILAFCFCERSLLFRKQLRMQANAREDRSAGSTPSVGNIFAINPLCKFLRERNGRAAEVAGEPRCLLIC